MADTATVGELLVRIRADVSDLDRGLNQAQAAVTGTTSRTVPGLRAIEGGFRALAFQAAGIPGPIGRISAALLHLGIGGVVTTGVLAGLAAIVIAWRKLTEASREAAKAQAEAIKAGLTTPLKQAQLQLNLADAAFAKAVSERDKARDRPFLAAANPEKYADDLAKANIKVQNARAATMQWREEVAKLDDALQTILDDIDKIGIRKRLTVEGLVPDVIGGPSLRELMGVGTLGNVQGVAGDIGATFAADRFVRRFNRELQRNYETMKTIGESIGAALADGINAVLSGGNFFKSFGRTLLGIAINIGAGLAGKAIGAALFPGTAALGPLMSGGASGGSSLASVAAPTGMLDFSNFPPATNPLAAARDAQWQGFFRESGLVARKYGYR